VWVVVAADVVMVPVSTTVYTAQFGKAVQEIVLEVETIEKYELAGDELME
jgi:hypothetical protein